MSDRRLPGLVSSLSPCGHEGKARDLTAGKAQAEEKMALMETWATATAWQWFLRCDNKNTVNKSKYK